MRILVLSNLYPPHVLGGYEILCGQVCARYARLGHEVVVFTTDHGVDGTPTSAPEIRDGCEVHRSLRLYLPFSQPPRLYRLRRLRTSRHNESVIRRFLERWRPDVVHVWSQLRLTLGAARACLKAGLPMVFSFNDEHVAGYVPAKFGLSPRSLARWFLDRVALRELTLAGLPVRIATAISDLTRRSLIRQGVDPPRFPVIYQGIPVENFPPRESPGRLSSPVKVLFVGQLLHYKGVHTVIEAAHRAAESGVDLTLTVAGAGDPQYTQELHRLAGRGPAAVAFAGLVSRTDIPDTYRAHDVFVFASSFDAFGLTHLEAMASGLPVISTLEGGQREFLVDGENCLVFPAGDAAALAGCLARLAGDPELALRLAEAGRRTAAGRFSLDRYVGELLDLLEEARR